jgi:hypothetical protein
MSFRVNCYFVEHEKSAFLREAVAGLTRQNKPFVVPVAASCSHVSKAGNSTNHKASLFRNLSDASRFQRNKRVDMIFSKCKKDAGYHHGLQ